MGVDCFGLSPRNPKNLEKPTIDWDTDPSEEERQEFWEAKEEYDKLGKEYSYILDLYMSDNTYYVIGTFEDLKAVGLDPGVPFV